VIYDVDAHGCDDLRYEEHRSRMSDLCEICMNDVVVESEDLCRACLMEVEAELDKIEERVHREG